MWEDSQFADMERQGYNPYSQTTETPPDTLPDWLVEKYGTPDK